MIKTWSAVSVGEVNGCLWSGTRGRSLSSSDCCLQGDGESAKRRVRTAGGLPETPGPPETASGTETRTAMKTRRTVNSTERGILIEMIVSGVPGLTPLFKHLLNDFLNKKKVPFCLRNNGISHNERNSG